MHLAKRGDEKRISLVGFGALELASTKGVDARWVDQRHGMTCFIEYSSARHSPCPSRFETGVNRLGALLHKPRQKRGVARSIVGKNLVFCFSALRVVMADEGRIERVLADIDSQKQDLTSSCDSPFYSPFCPEVSLVNASSPQRFKPSAEA